MTISEDVTEAINGATLESAHLHDTPKHILLRGIVVTIELNSTSTHAQSGSYRNAYFGRIL